jgi:hypothetical protein
MIGRVERWQNAEISGGDIWRMAGEKWVTDSKSPTLRRGFVYHNPQSRWSSGVGHVSWSVEGFMLIFSL